MSSRIICPITRSSEQPGRGDSSAVGLVTLLLGILTAPVVRPAVTQFRNVGIRHSMLTCSYCGAGNPADRTECRDCGTDLSAPDDSVCDRVASAEPDVPKPRFLANTLLLLIGLTAHLPLSYQLHRWSNGFTPTFIHPDWIERDPSSLSLAMVRVHPLVWIAVSAFAFWRICRNYGWYLSYPA